MKVKKAIKKIVALGLGATMLGATLFGAAAANLEDFPSDFITADGEFDGLFVVGAEAAAADIVGITAIAQTVQANAIKRTWHDLEASEASFTTADGVFLVDDNDELFAGSAAASVSDLDDEDFPDLLADGVVEDTDFEDEEYDYKQSVSFTSLDVNFEETADDDTNGLPVVQLEMPNDAYVYTVEFTDALDIARASGEDDEEGFQNSEEIELLGETYTFKSGLSLGDDITLYKSSETKLLQIGEQVEVKDGEYVVEVVAINAESANEKATLRVNGETETFESGDQKEVGGLEIKIDEIQVNTVGEEVGFVKVFLGADELIIQNSASYKDVEVNGEDIDGVQAKITGTLDALDSIEFEFTPSEFDDEVEELLVGESFVDPLFGVFSYQFVEAGADEDGTLSFESNYDEVELTYTNVDGDEYSINLVEMNADSDVEPYSSSSYDISASVFTGADLTGVVEDEVFILSEDTGDDEVTSFYKVLSIDQDADVSDDSEVEIENLNSGATKIFNPGDEIWDTNAFVAGINAADFDITTDGVNSTGANDVAGLTYVITEGMQKVAFSVAGEVYTATVSELAASDKYDDVTKEDGTNVTMTYDGTDVDELHLTTVNGEYSWTPGDDDYDDYAYYMSMFGITGVEDTNDEKSVEFTTYKRAVEYNVLFGPTSATADEESGADGYYTTEVVAIPAERSVLDTEVTGAMSENLIVVGGPCANSVASALMGSPADCTAGFNPGEAIIKLFDETDGMASGKVALLVAGFSAEDTRAASAAVAGMSEDLTGKEVVLTTSIQTVTETEEVEDNMEEPVDAE